MITIAPTARAYMELARLSELTQQPEAAQTYYKAGLEHAAQP